LAAPSSWPEAGLARGSAACSVEGHFLVSEMAGKIKGFLDFKLYSVSGDTWPPCLCEFDPSTKQLSVSLKKGGKVLLSAQVQEAK
jgi:hypothetical protein